jgi:hypothetical protein
MNKYLIFPLLFLVSLFSFAETRLTLDSLLNKEFYIPGGFAGGSITLIKESGEYFLVRKDFGSGLPVIQTLKYSGNLISSYKIIFSTIIQRDNEIVSIEDIRKFTILIDENNNVKILINDIERPELTVID